MIKLIALVKKKRSMTVGEFRDYWINVHAPLARKIPGMRGYRINVAGAPGDMTPAPYDGTAEIWFDDRAAMEAGLSSPENDVAGGDVVNFTDDLVFLVCEDEAVIIDQCAAEIAA
ncbi:MAG: EthD family reductase [Phyllobacteriaceae bacterium]|nr:EthD family reductase [Phyllobacteriaceae bacterium]